MTFKDVQRLMQSQPDYYSSQQSEMLDKLRGKSFYYWDHTNIMGQVNHSRTKMIATLNHIIGLSTKDGIEKPLFDYERDIYFALLRPGYPNSYPSTNQFNIKRDNVLYPFKEKHLWIKKAGSTSPV